MGLREDARRILGAALVAADPAAAVRRALALDGHTLRFGDERMDLAAFERVRLLGAGKASPGMALAALHLLDDRVSGGAIATTGGQDRLLQDLPATIEVFEAGHPVPDARGVAAAAAALRLARDSGERDLLLCLLSGGASALWAAPVEGVELADLRALTDALLRSGATIRELNTVRKHLSRLAGGRLARVAHPARALALVVSDVVGSPLDVAASGPTVPDPTTYADALHILALRGVEASPAALTHLRAGARGERSETPKPGDPAFERASTRVILRNRDALGGAAEESRRLGYRALPLTDRLEGEAREAGRLLAALGLGAREDGLPLGPPVALLLGGETTVTVRGEGRGGRNQEMALAAALALEGEGRVLVACLGTDGADGPTDAAGALVDGDTVRRGAERGLDAWDCLRRNDSYAYLRATGDLLLTGPTGTNVNDVALVLVGG